MTWLRALPVSFLFLVLAACGGGNASPATPDFAEISPAAGKVSLANAHADHKISGFVFENQGDRDVILTDIEVTLATGKVIHASAGVGVQRGGPAITFLFDAAETHEVRELSFTVDGSTSKLVIHETDATGHLPVAQ